MTDRYDDLRVSPDPSRAEELRQRLHAELDRSSLDDASGPRARLTIAPPAGGAEIRPMEEMRMSDHPADSEHNARWRTPTAAAAAIVVLGVGAIAFAVSNTNADDPDGVSQAPAPTTTVVPRVVTYTGIPGVPITYTLPDGWEDEADDGSMVDNGPGEVRFWDIANVYADGCEHTLLDPPLGPTVDDLATVWATLPGFTATTPVDITVDGYAGKHVDYSLPDYPTVAGPNDFGRNADCAGNTFALWNGSWAQVPRQQNRQWILDVNGTRLVINEWSEPGTTPEQLADMDEFLASIQIG